jgi:hypothetical protein
MLVRVDGLNTPSTGRPDRRTGSGDPLEDRRATGTVDAERRGDVTAVLTPDLLSPEPLTALDRCDRCGAKAYLRVTLASGGELLFCAHHGKKYEESLRSIAAEIHDESEKLSTTEASAPADER